MIGRWCDCDWWLSSGVRAAVVLQLMQPYFLCIFTPSPLPTPPYWMASDRAWLLRALGMAMLPPAHHEGECDTRAHFSLSLIFRPKRRAGLNQGGNNTSGWLSLKHGSLTVEMELKGIFLPDRAHHTYHNEHNQTINHGDRYHSHPSAARLQRVCLLRRQVLVALSNAHHQRRTATIGLARRAR